MAEEIIFSEYQAEVFNEAEMMLRTQGYLGEQLFEDTYVLQKRLADWVIDAVPVNGSTSSLMSEATNAYNGVLGIATDEAPPPVIDNPVRSEPVRPDVPVSVRPVFTQPDLPFRPTVSIRPMRPVKPAIATPVATAPPRPSVRPVPTSVVRGNSGGGRGNLSVFSGPVLGGVRPSGNFNGMFGGVRNTGGNPGNGMFGNGLFGGFGGRGGFTR